jgi:hydrogenase 3 maturation protease
MALSKAQLKKQLKGAQRLAILGIGSALRGDDALGLKIVAQLKKESISVKRPLSIKLFSCATTPENSTGEIRQFNPTHIIIVDALYIGKRPGSLSLVDLRQASFNVSFSTHGLPLKMLARYLARSLSCRVLCIGVEPKSLEFNAALSKEAERAVKKVCALIKGVLKY